MGPHVGASLPSLLWSSPGPPTVPSGLLGSHSWEGQGPLKRLRGPAFCPERHAISLCQGCRGCWGVWIPTCPYSISACRVGLEPRALSNEWLLGQDCTWALAGGWDYGRQSLLATQDAKVSGCLCCHCRAPAMRGWGPLHCSVGPATGTPSFHLHSPL